MHDAFPTVGSTDLVGRDVLLARCREAMDDGVPLLLLTGPAAGGRSAVLDAVAAAGRDRGYQVQQLRGVRGTAVPPLAPLLPLLPRAADSPAADAVLSGMAAALGTLRGAGRPVLLTVDDGDLLDDSSAAVLRLAVDQGLARLVVTATQASSLPADLADLVQARGRDLHVDPLPPAVAAELLGRLLGPVDGLTARRLVRRSEGLPGVLTALVRSGRRRGVLLRDRHGVWTSTEQPVGEAGAPAALVHAVPDHLHSLLLHVALVGALGRHAAPGPPADVESALDEGLLRLEVGGRRETLRLTSPTLQDALVAGCGSGTRRRLLGELLAERRRHRRRDGDALAVAQLALEARLPLSAEEVLHAGRAARAIAPGVVEQIVAALPADAPPAAQTQARWLHAESLVRRGHGAEAARLLRQQPEPAVGAIGEQLAEDAAFARALHAATLLFRPEQGRRAAADVLAGYDLDAPGGDQAAATMSWVLVFSAAPADGDDLARSVLADDRAGDAACLWAVTGRVLALAALGRPDTARTLLPLGHEFAERVGDADPYGHDQLGWAEVLALVVSGRVALAEELTRASLDRALRRDDPVRIAVWTGLRAVALRCAGRLPAAAGCLREVLALLGDGDPYGGGSVARSELAAIEAQRGDLPAARALVAAGLPDLNALAGTGLALFAPALSAARGWLEVAGALHAGPTTGARRALAAAAAASPAMPGMAALAAVEALRMGAPREALVLLERLGELVEGPGPAAYARAARALRTGDPAGAEAAGEQIGLLGAQLPAAELLTHVAARAGAGPAHARALLTRNALLALCSGDGDQPHTPLLRLRDLPGAALSDREREVAALAAHGLSSAQIAERLVLSVRTVDNHLGRAYGKLGLTGRAQLLDIWPTGA